MLTIPKSSLIDRNISSNKMKFISTLVLLLAPLAAANEADTCADRISPGQEFTIQANWNLKKGTAVTYPCSAGYAKNFAANNRLLKNVLKAIDNEYDGCSALCNIDNASYVVESVSGRQDLSKRLLDEETCDALSGKFGFANDACKCDSNGNGVDTSVYGCAKCRSVVKFKVSECLDLVPN